MIQFNSSQTLARHGNRRRGALTVEFALCLPILFMVLFGCYELSKANMIHHAAENAAYEAARAGIVPGATPKKCQDQAAAVLRAIGIRNFTIVVSPNKIDRDTPTVAVQVEIPLRNNTIMAPMFFGSSVFRGVCEMQREAL